MRFKISFQDSSSWGSSVVLSTEVSVVETSTTTGSDSTCSGTGGAEGIAEELDFLEDLLEDFLV